MPTPETDARAEAAAPTADADARAKPAARGERRGVALVLVLASLTLMAILVTDFQEQQPLDLKSAQAERDALQAEYMARSGVNLTRLFIASEPTMRQGLGILRFFFKGGAVPQLPVWEFSDQVLGAFSDEEGQKSFASMGGFDLSNSKHLGGPKGARFTVKVVPEDDKINVNLGARGNAISENRFGLAFLGLVSAPSFDPLFERNDRDGNTSDRLTICGALMDWSDPDEQLYACQPRNFQGGGSAGGEDQSTQMLPRPYRVKNAAYDSLEELHLVRGVGDDFWSTFIEPVPGDPKKRVMTVWGPGAVNVNTAAPQVVVAMVCGLAPDAAICTDLAKNAQFLTMFGVLRSFTAGMPLFGTPNDFVATIQGGGAYGKLLFDTLSIPPVRFQSPAEAAKNFTTESKVFSIIVTGEVEQALEHDGQRKVLSHVETKITAVVDFRGAPGIPDSVAPPGTMPGMMNGKTTAAAPVGSTAGPGAVANAGGIGGTPAGAGADAIMGALAANPAGTVVYFRIE